MTHLGGPVQQVKRTIKEEIEVKTSHGDKATLHVSEGEVGFTIFKVEDRMTSCESVRGLDGLARLIDLLQATYEVAQGARRPAPVPLQKTTVPTPTYSVE
jgi:hypothetical protein